MDNRALRLKAILQDGKPHDSCTLTRQLNTWSGRAVAELRRLLVGTGYELKTVRHETHNEHNHAIYQLIHHEEQLTLI